MGSSIWEIKSLGADRETRAEFGNVVPESCAAKWGGAIMGFGRFQQGDDEIRLVLQSFAVECWCSPLE